MTNGFTRRKAQSQEEIRKAARDLFSQFGVERVSIADIAHKAGVSQATIYNNFENKDALVREFIADAVEQLLSRVQEVLESKQQYHEKMSAFIEFIAEMMAEQHFSPADRALFSSSSDLQNDPEIKKVREESQQKMIGLMLGLMREGRLQGKVNPNLSDEALTIYFSIFMAVFSNPELQPQYNQNPALVKQLGTMMLCGLSNPPG